MEKLFDARVQELVRVKDWGNDMVTLANRDEDGIGAEIRLRLLEEIVRRSALPQVLFEEAEFVDSLRKQNRATKKILEGRQVDVQDFYHTVNNLIEKKRRPGENVAEVLRNYKFLAAMASFITSIFTMGCVIAITVLASIAFRVLVPLDAVQ